MRAAVVLAAVVLAAFIFRRELENMTLGVNQETVQNKNVQAFLRMIRVGEGTADALGYQRIFGSLSGAQFTSFADHPRKVVCKSIKGQGICSSAAGAYQILQGTWDEVAKSYGLKDFSPASQDLAAVALIKRRGALLDVLQGSIESALNKCAKEWASLPNAPYGQPTVTMAAAISNFNKYGGVLA